MDPLALLREFTMQNKAVTMEGDHLVFGTTRYHRSAPTALRTLGKGEFYALESLWFFLRHQTDSQAEYFRKCLDEKIKQVSLPDKAAVKQYLEGKSDSCNILDYAAYTAPQPEVLPEATFAPAVEEAEAMAVDDEEEERRRAAEAARSRALAASREAFLQILSDPRGVNEPKPPAKPREAAEGEGAAAGEAPAESAHHRAKLFVKEDREPTRRVVRRERRVRSRKSVLLSPTAASFPLVLQILEGFRKENERAIAEEERRKAAAVQREREGKGGRAAAAARVAAAEEARPGEAVKAVIIVPSSVTAMINMWNVRELLEENKFTPAMEKKQTAKAKETSIAVRHTFEDGSTAEFIVTDSPLKQPAAVLGAQWRNVAAAFVQGQTWQFKDWPMKSVVEVPNQTVKQWACMKLAFSKQRSKAHEVGVLMASFWSSLHAFLSKNKPHLLQRPPASEAAA
ncbi:hypothetical protein AB1Y20_002144 [Prymnesium parvum]|uniref:Cell division control protein 73 C-terminal domain-containing protein n=1 Tax=Prymnesium parvum TaxID=97485 RepID=A0AB34JAU5_PRYPA